MQSRLPGNRVIPDPLGRRLLLKIGAEMGHVVEHTLDIVNIKTYRRWLLEEQGGRQVRKAGRPRLTRSLRELILRLARENLGWGARRIGLVLDGLLLLGLSFGSRMGLGQSRSTRNIARLLSFAQTPAWNDILVHPEGWTASGQIIGQNRDFLKVHNSLFNKQDGIFGRDSRISFWFLFICPKTG